MWSEGGGVCVCGVREEGCVCGVREEGCVCVSERKYGAKEY